MAITKASSSAVAPAAKGDLVAGSATNDSGILAVGSASQVLTVDSSTATGLKWATPSGAPADNWVQVATSSASSVSSISFTSLTGYKKLMLVANNFASSANNVQAFLRFNANSGSIYRPVAVIVSTSLRNAGSTDTEAIGNMYLADTSNGRSSLMIFVDGCNGGGYKPYRSIYTGNDGSARAVIGEGVFLSTSDISSIDLTIASGTMSALGTIYLYGVA